MKQLVELVKTQSFFCLKSQGESMFPLLQPNDIVYFKKIAFSKIKTYDLIVFYKKNQIISHRVIYKNKNYLITKGDNSHQPDGKIFPSQILGKIYQIKRNGKKLNPETSYLLQSTHYFNEIIKIKNEFNRQKINHLFLKGLPLHLYFEKTHPQRIYADCDVLVRREDYLKAEKILFRFGYKKISTDLSLFHKKLTDKVVEHAYYKILNGFPVVFDLHQEVVFMMTQIGKLDALYRQKMLNQLTEEFFQTKKEIEINGDKFWILDFGFLILYLALHFFHHNFRGIFQLEFLNKIIIRLKPPPLTWKNLTKKICYYQLQNFIFPVFVLLKKHYQTPLPPFFLKKIQPSSSCLRYLSPIINRPSLVFNDETRLTAGVNRFKNLFFLSPQPLGIRLLVFFKPAVIYSIIWFLQKKLFSFLSKQK